MDMKGRSSLVVGNWKMNGSLALAENWAKELAALWRQAAPAAEAGLCVPSVFLDRLVRSLRAEGLEAVEPGAEDVSVREGCGAFTGEVSASMLRDAGARLCIVGHSERRTLFGESNASVVLKVKALAAQGIRPIVCVGETREEREAGRTSEVILAQVRAVLEGCGIESLSGGAFAYEPLWAIGSGAAASLEQIEPVHAAIRAALCEADAGASEKVRVLYGGSVKPANASAILALPHVDGALVGGASLKAESFYGICACGR